MLVSIGLRSTAKSHDISFSQVVQKCNNVHLNYVKCIIVYTHITLELYRLD